MEKSRFWFDALLTIWVITVGVVYFGGLFSPPIAALTTNFSAVYAMMVLASALALALRFLHSERGKRAKNGK